MLTISRNLAEEKQSTSSRAKLKAAIALAGGAAVLAGCSSTQSEYTPPSMHLPNHAYIVSQGSDVNIPYSLQNMEDGDYNDAATYTSYVLRAHKIGRRITFQIFLGEPNDMQPIMLMKNSDEFMTSNNKAEIELLKKSNYAPDEFTVPATTGSEALYTYTSPGSANGYPIDVDVKTDGAGATSVSLIDPAEILAQKTQ